MIPHKYVELFTHYLPILLPLGAMFLSRFILLTVALLIMLRCQGLNYNIPGLLGSSFLASTLDMFPIFGHFAAAGALLFCVLKMTNSHLVDVRFTVSISYAVMFLMQMLLLAVLPMDLKVYARTPKKYEDFNLMAKVKAAQESAQDEADGEVDVVAKTNEAPTAPQAASTTPVAKTPPAPVASRGNSQYARDFSLKGVMKNANDSMVMVNTGTKTYSIRLGESMIMDTPSGKVDVQVDDVTATSAVLKVGGIATSLRLR